MPSSNRSVQMFLDPASTTRPGCSNGKRTRVASIRLPRQQVPHLSGHAFHAAFLVLQQRHPIVLPYEDVDADRQHSQEVILPLQSPTPPTRQGLAGRSSRRDDDEKHPILLLRRKDTRNLAGHRQHDKIRPTFSCNAETNPESTACHPAPAQRSGTRNRAPTHTATAVRLHGHPVFQWTSHFSPPVYPRS